MAIAGAGTVQVNEVSINGGATAVRVDVSPLAGRYMVRIINPNPTQRVFIGHTQATVNTTCDAADPNNYPYEDFIGPGVQLWAKTEDGSTFTIRLKQYAP